MFPEKSYKDSFINFALFNNCNSRQLIGPTFHVHAFLTETNIITNNKSLSPNSHPHPISRL